MKKSSLALLVVGGAITVAGAYLILKGKAVGSSTIRLDYNDQLGAVIIDGAELSPGEYVYDGGGALTLTAVPRSPYYFMGWIIDGISHGTHTATTLSLTEKLHLVTAVFSTEQPNGAGPPSTIYPMSSPVSVTQRVACGVVQGGWTYWPQIRFVGADWGITPDEYLTGERIEFKVEDSAGNPVKDVEVQMWTDNMPDDNDVGFNLCLGGIDQIHEAYNPLVVKTLADGVAGAYFCYKPQNIFVFSKQHYNLCNNLGACQCVENEAEQGGWAGARSIKYDCPGGGNDVPDNHLRLPTTHTIMGKVKDTALLTQAAIDCEMQIRMV